MKKNILFLSSWYPNRVKPTLGNFVQKHAEACNRYNHVVALFVCSDQLTADKYEVVETTINGVPTIHVYYRRVAHNIPLIAPAQKAFRYLRAHQLGLKTVRRQLPKIDLVHHNIVFPAGIIAWYLKKFKGIPYIITENWTGYLPAKRVKLSWLEYRLSKMIADTANCITPVSMDLETAMKELKLGKQFEIIYNVTDTDLFHPRNEDPAPAKIRFLHVSTLDDAHKNISGMLRVVQKLAQERTDFEVWFVGDGDIAPHQKTAEKLGILNKFAFFDGSKTTAEVAQLMQGANCFLLFSNYENLPCVMVEALASGLPIVSSTAGGIPEHVTSDLGYLVAPLDEANLLRSMNAAITKIKAQGFDSKFLSNYANQHFSYESVGKQFDQLYNKILSKQHE